MRFKFNRLVVANIVGYPIGDVTLVDGAILALHGDNGAGKTSLLAMTLAVLVPDAKKIDEAIRGGSPNKSGLEGRVCLQGAPSYALLEIRKDEEQLILGVQFRDLGAGLPKVIPFLIQGLPSDSRVQALLLTPTASGERRVATLDEIHQATGLQGGTLTEFSNERDYYARLENLGVIPNTLSTRGDRDQWANILLFGFGRRSDDIIGSLKAYLLPEDHTLGRSIETMDEAYRSVVAYRKKIQRYRSTAARLRDFWTLASNTMAFANFAVRAEQLELRKEVAIHETEQAALRDKLRDATRIVTHGEKVRTRLMDRSATADRAKTFQRDQVRDHLKRLDAVLAGAVDFNIKVCALRHLREELNRPLLGPVELANVRAAILSRKVRLREFKTRLGRLVAALEVQAREAAGITRAPTFNLPRLADDPRLMDMDEESAANLEARLGPASSAYVSSEPLIAADRALGERRADHVWIIDPVDVNAVMGGESTASTDGAIVQEGFFVRASRLPKQPLFGRGSRERAARRIAKARDILGRIASKEALLDRREEDVLNLHGAPREVFDAVETVDETMLRTRNEALKSGLAEIERHPTSEPSNPALLEEDLMHLNQFRKAAVKYDQATELASKHQTKFADAKKDSVHYRTNLDRLVAALAKHKSALDRANTNRATWAVARGNDSALAEILDEAHFEKALSEEHATYLRFQESSRSSLEDLVRLVMATPEFARTATDHGLNIIALGDDARDGNADKLVRLWQEVRRLALILMPEDLASSSDDPTRNLSLLADAIASVEDQLVEAEATFRNRASSLEPNIVSALRRSGSVIDRLSRNHGGASFGNFDGIRLKVTRSERMLDALRAVTQREADLFSVSENLRDALGKAIATIEAEGGESLGFSSGKLFDYRTYASVGVEVRRRGEERWQSLHLTGASNGEDIGISFVALCMILAEWERRRMDASGSRAESCLRLLILDEATQVDDQGLATIATFAEGLGATVVLASPKVIRVAGRSTVYSLVGNAGGEGRVRMTLLRGRVVSEAPATAGPLESQHG